MFIKCGIFTKYFCFTISQKYEQFHELNYVYFPTYYRIYGMQHSFIQRINPIIILQHYHYFSDKHYHYFATLTLSSLHWSVILKQLRELTIESCWKRTTKLVGEHNWILNDKNWHMQ